MVFPINAGKASYHSIVNKTMMATNSLSNHSSRFNGLNTHELLTRDDVLPLAVY